MTILNTIDLWWLLAALPIVALYALRIRQRRQAVAATMIWREVVGDRQASVLLRRLLGLGLHLAVLVLLVAALAEVTTGTRSAPRHLVLIVDNSASMQTADLEADTARLAAAKSAAETLIDELRDEDQMTILSAGDQVTRHFGATAHRRTLQVALAGIESTDGPTRVTEAVEVARSLLEDHRNGRIVVVTDGAFDGASDLAAAADVQLIVAAGRAGNAAITRLELRGDLVDSGRYELLLEVANYADTALDCEVAAKFKGENIAVPAVTASAGGTWSTVIPIESTEGGLLTVRLDHQDEVAGDNEAETIVPASRIRRVRLVTQGSELLERVFRSMPTVQLDVVEAFPRSAENNVITVFDRISAARLPDGPVIVINPPEDSELWKLGDIVRNPVVTQQDEVTGLVAHCRLDEAQIAEARPVRSEQPSVSLAQTADGQSIYHLIQRKSGPVLVLSVNLDKGDLRHLRTFPLLMANAVQWLGRGTTSGVAGEFFSGVQLTNAAESDLRPHAESNDAPPVPSAATWGLYLVGAAWLLLGLEWIGYHRRRTV